MGLRNDIFKIATGLLISFNPFNQNLYTLNSKLEKIIINQTRTEIKDFEIKEKVNIDENLVNVYFNWFTNPEKIYYVEGNLDKKEEALFTAIMQRLLKLYKKNVEALGEWEEDRREYWRRWRLNFGGPEFYELTENLWRDILGYLEGRNYLPGINPEGYLFTFFYKNKIEGLEKYEPPLSTNEALEIYKILKDKENLKKYVSMFWAKELKDPCIKARNEWIDPYVVRDIYEWYIDDFRFGLYDVDPFNKEEVSKRINEIRKKHKWNNFSDTQIKQRWWGILYNFGFKGLKDTGKGARARWLLYNLIWAEIPLSRMVDVFRYNFEADKNIGKIYRDLKGCIANIDSVIEEYNFINLKSQKK